MGVTQLTRSWSWGTSFVDDVEEIGITDYHQSQERTLDELGDRETKVHNFMLKT